MRAGCAMVCSSRSFRRSSRAVRLIRGRCRAVATRNPTCAPAPRRRRRDPADSDGRRVAQRLVSSHVPMSVASRVLVADDQSDILEALRWLLAGEGYDAHFVTTVDEVMARLQAETFDLLLMDLNYSRDTTSGREGLEL